MTALQFQTRIRVLATRGAESRTFLRPVVSEASPISANADALQRRILRPRETAVAASLSFRTSRDPIVGKLLPPVTIAPPACPYRRREPANAGLLERYRRSRLAGLSTWRPKQRRPVASKPGRNHKSSGGAVQ